jgi:hypothetical protein
LGWVGATGGGKFWLALGGRRMRAIAAVLVATAACAFAQRLTDDATAACYVTKSVIIGANSIASFYATDSGLCCLACYEIEGCQAWTMDYAYVA